MNLRIYLFIFSILISINIVILSIAGENHISWPAIDNLPAVCRLLDPNCLANDFFTNASYEFNPRSFYIYTLALITKILNIGVTGGLVFIKVLLIISLPIAILFTFIYSIKNNYGNDSNLVKINQFLILVSFPMAIYFALNGGGAYLSVAWWTALTFHATAHNLSLLLTLLGGILFLKKYKKLASLMIFSAGIYHPSVALLTAIFITIISIKIDKFMEVISYCKWIFLPLILSVILLKLSFQNNATLTASDLFQIYVVEGHPFHYLPSQFGTFSIHPWWYTFGLVSIIFLILSFSLFLLRQPAWKNSLLLLVAYVLSILIQYIFVEKFHLRPLIELGVSRFTTYGAWGLYYYSIIILSCLTNLIVNKKIQFNIVSKYFDKLYKINFINLFISIISIALIMSWSWKYINKIPFALWDDEKSIGVVNFAKKTTDTGIWLLPFNISRPDFPFYTNKGVFIGNGFPFNEKYLEEWRMRNELVNGNNNEVTNLPGDWIGEQWSNYYRSLKPKDVVNIGLNYKLDYFVVERNFDSNFKKCSFIYIDNYYKIMTLDEIKKCS